MDCATCTRKERVVVWLVWLLVLVVVWQRPGLSQTLPDNLSGSSVPVVLTTTPVRDVFPWWPRWRWRKWALARYQRWQRARRAAKRAAGLARWALAGMLSLAQVVDWLTHCQLQRQLGALPVLYAVLDSLQVRAIINRYYPQTRTVDDGTVALVLILNRLLAPRALHRVADWYARTALVHQLGVPAARFNDDRLARTLDALAPHGRDIWLAVVSAAIERYEIDLSLIFYDLTAFVTHGAYIDSQFVDFGFAHNTPINKRKFKVGVDASADGNIPLLYQTWAGHTADKATVAANLERLAGLLAAQHWPTEQVLLLGDCANLNDRLALLYDRQGIHYLSKAPLVKKVHQALVADVAEADFYRLPLTADLQPTYWGVPVRVPFESDGQRVQHCGLVVLSGPLREAWGQTRREQFAALETVLRDVQQKAARGAPKYRTQPDVHERIRRRLKASPVGQFMLVTVEGTPGSLQVQWSIDQRRLAAAMRQDGRYLLVTNQPTLTPQEMFQRYGQKDGVEKDFTICKHDLRVRPIYLHQDQRIEAMLLLNMLALLTYTVLERELRHAGLQLTTRRLIEQLESLTLIETHCRDGSVLLQLTPLSPDQHRLVRVLAQLELLRPSARSHGPSLETAPWPPAERLLLDG
jgi:transposase